MLNPDEATIELKKYLKKLKYLIENDASFSLFNTAIVDKKKIDDILCCVEASIPEDYRAFVKKNGAHRLKSYSNYTQLLKAIKNKFFLSSNMYKINFSEAIKYIQLYSRAIDSDIKFIYSDQFGMF